MICLLQRVSEASVVIEGDCVGEINAGLMVLVGFQAKDADQESGVQQTQLARMADRLLGYRVFPDEDDRMNRSVLDAGAGVLLVPQFTLAADTRKGLRPGFQSAAPPKSAETLFQRFVSEVQQRHGSVQQGQFGADMKVSLVNDGPVTFWLEL